MALSSATVDRLAGDHPVEAARHSEQRGLPPTRKDPRYTLRLRSGHWVSIRPIRPQDAPALAAAVERLSALSRYRRFHSALPRLTEQMITYLTDIDHHNHEALVAVPPGTGGMIIGVARFIRDPAHPDTAEVAIVIDDHWQRRGLGTLLLRRLARRAIEVGIRSVTGDILAENHPTLELARSMGARSLANHGSTVTTNVDIADWADEDSDAGSLRALMAAEVALVPRLIQPMVVLSGQLIRTFAAPISHATRTATRPVHVASQDPRPPGHR